MIMMRLSQLFGIVIALLVGGVALAQQRQLSNTSVNTGQNLLTLTGQGAGTVRSVAQAGTGRTLSCILNQTGFTGTPSTTFAIELVVPGSGTTPRVPLLTSAAITANSANPIAVGTGVPPVANKSAQVVVPQNWDVAVTVGGTATPTITGTVSCTASD